MKKRILLAAVAAFAIVAARAQEIPDRKREESKPVMKERIMNKKERANLNLTDDQKAKFKSMNQDFRKKMEDLRKEESLSSKDYAEKMEQLRKEHQEQFQSLLTPEQKTEMQKYKDLAKAKSKVFGARKQAKLKERLNLTDEQLSKMAENRQMMKEKIGAIRENKSLTEMQQKEEIKELMKKQRESLRSILTKEQMQKMKEGRKKHSRRREVI